MGKYKTDTTFFNLYFYNTSPAISGCNHVYHTKLDTKNHSYDSENLHHDTFTKKILFSCRNFPRNSKTINTVDIY